MRADVWLLDLYVARMRDLEMLDGRMAIANEGLPGAIARDPTLGRGINATQGRLTRRVVAEAHREEYRPVEDLLPA